MADRPAGTVDEAAQIRALLRARERGGYERGKAEATSRADAADHRRVLLLVLADALDAAGVRLTGDDRNARGLAALAEASALLRDAAGGGDEPPRGADG